MHELAFAANQLTATIPTELGRLNSLIWLYVDGNDLVGHIPSEFGQLFSLQELFLADNNLSGHIPESLELLVASDILIIDIGNNTGLSGVIPEELCVLDKNLTFDCSSYLCGCDWCKCNEGMNGTNHSSQGGNLTNDRSV